MASIIITYFKINDSKIQHWNILTTRQGYFFYQVLSTQDYQKLLPNSEVVIDFRYSNNYKFGGNNFFFIDFYCFDL